MLGWIALDQSEVRSIAKKIAIPGSVGTVDELGLGLIIDSVSQFLFPAFTTLMTRARYFILARSVFDIAARTAWQKSSSSFREEECHLGNQALITDFKRYADRTFEDVDLAICLALSTTKLLNAEAGDGPDFDGIAGSRNIRRRLKKGGLPTPPLFRILERYPAALYFSGLRTLGAFSQPVQDREHLWELYLRFFLGDRDIPIWDGAWADVTESTGSMVSKLYSDFRSAREKGSSKGWEIIDGYKLTFQLTKREAALLHERLCKADRNPERSSAIASTMILANGVTADHEGYATLSKVCEKKNPEAASAFFAAANAMAAMHPALTLYQNLRERLDPRLSKKEREDIAYQLCARLDFKRAKKSVDLLTKGWSPDGGWGKAKFPIQWLSRWLDEGIRSTSRNDYLGIVRKLIVKENQTVRSRRKLPCLSQDPIALTARGRKERDKKARYDYDSEPPEAFVPRGRLARALEIYSDIARGLKGGG